MSDPIDACRRWVETSVIGLDLCPFAQAVARKNLISYIKVEAATLGDAIEPIAAAMTALPDAAHSTTLLVLPGFGEFDLFLDLMALADGLIADLDLEGVLQVASFHPAYQFAGTDPDAVGNYTNRSPFPILQLLQEADVTRAVESHPDPDGIPDRNVARLEALGLDAIRRLTTDRG